MLKGAGRDNIRNTPACLTGFTSALGERPFYYFYFHHYYCLYACTTAAQDHGAPNLHLFSLGLCSGPC